MSNAILRTWSATKPNAERYVAFFRTSLVPELRKLQGFREAIVSTRMAAQTDDDLVIDVVTFWDSMEAVAHFAGDPIDRAVVEPEAQALLTTYDENVVHHEERLRVTSS